MSNTLTKLKRLRTLAEELAVVTDNYKNTRGEFFIDEEDFKIFKPKSTEMLKLLVSIVKSSKQ